MKEKYGGEEISGGGYIQRKVWRHVRLSITYLMCGLEGIAAVVEFGRQSDPPGIG
jgi:hypothetical protein